MLLGALGDVSISWGQKGLLGDKSVLTLAGPHLHHQMQQQETAHSLQLSTGDQKGSYRAPPILL